MIAVVIIITIIKIITNNKQSIPLSLITNCIKSPPDTIVIYVNLLLQRIPYNNKEERK